MKQRILQNTFVNFFFCVALANQREGSRPYVTSCIERCFEGGTRAPVNGSFSQFNCLVDCYAVRLMFVVMYVLSSMTTMSDIWKDPTVMFISSVMMCFLMKKYFRAILGIFTLKIRNLFRDLVISLQQRALDWKPCAVKTDTEGKKIYAKLIICYRITIYKNI